MNIRATRLANDPIIGPHLDPSIGVNIQGPSLIRVPDWIEHHLGAYYLYSLVPGDEIAGAAVGRQPARPSPSQGHGRRNGW